MENLNKFPLHKFFKSLCLLLAALGISFNALAQTEVTVDGINYSIEEETATVEGLADESITNLSIPESITVDSKSYTVIAIGDFAFEFCSDLTSVTIGNSVTAIGVGAFLECSGLTSVTIGNSVTTIGLWAFDGCSGLTSVDIPNSVTIINSYAFRGCSGLTSVTIPTSVAGFGSWAFAFCSGLTSVTFNCNLSFLCGIGEGFFSGCTNLESFSGKYASEDHRCLIIGGTLNSFAPANLTEYSIHESVTKIGSNAFYGCSGLTSVTIPNSVTSIGSSAFEGCSGLTSVDIPNSVTVIPSSAFSGCSGLTSVDIPNSVTIIRSSAFSGCSGLTSVDIPNSVTELGINPFVECTNLESFSGKYASEDHRCLIIDGTLNSFASANLTEYTIPNSVTAIGDYAFSYCSGLESVTIGNSVTEIGENTFAYCSSLTSINIGNSVTSIGNYAFYDCSSLTSVDIPNSVVELGWYPFRGCTNLESFSGKFASEDHRCLIVDGMLKSFAPANLTEYSIPNSVTSIGSTVFSDCSGLTSVSIPNSVTSIGHYAFEYCSGLMSVTVDNPDPANIRLGWDVFYDVPTNECTLYVPKGSVELYKIADQWNEFGKIEEFESDGIADAETGIALRSVGDGFLAIGTAAGERVEVYGFDGALIYSGVTADGETFIPASAKACILRIGAKTLKLAK